MAKVVWNGDPMVLSVPQVGSFTRGEPVEVTDEIAAFLTKNSEGFKLVQDEPKPDEKPKLPAGDKKQEEGEK